MVSFFFFFCGLCFLLSFLFYFIFLALLDSIWHPRQLHRCKLLTNVMYIKGIYYSDTICISFCILYFQNNVFTHGCSQRGSCRSKPVECLLLKMGSRTTTTKKDCCQKVFKRITSDLLVLCQ